MIHSSVNSKVDQSWTLLTTALTPFNSTTCCPLAWKCCSYSLALRVDRSGSWAPSHRNVINTPKGKVPVKEQSRESRQHHSQTDHAHMGTKPQHVKQTPLSKAPLYRKPLCYSSFKLSVYELKKNPTNHHQFSFSIIHCTLSNWSSLLIWLFYRTNPGPPEVSDLKKIPAEP